MMNTRMRRGRVWIVVGVVAATSVVAVLVLIWLGRTAPDIPHGVEGRSNCTSCHVLVRLPDDHRTRSDDSCLDCHSPAPG